MIIQQLFTFAPLVVATGVEAANFADRNLKFNVKNVHRR